MSNIIGLSSYSRGGKDTFFKILALNDGRYKRHAFADALKEEIREECERMGVDPFTENDELKKIVRPVMIRHGEMRRNENPNYWLDKVMSEIDADTSDETIHVITDVRYKNEAEEVIKRGGVIICIHREGGKPGSETEAESLKEIFEWDCDYIFDYVWDDPNIASSPNWIETHPEINSVKAAAMRHLNYQLLLNKFGSLQKP